MRKKLALLAAFIMILNTAIFPSFASAAENPSRAELEALITEVAIERGIPSVILMSIARVETVFKHYEEDGTVARGTSGSIGLMQIHNNYGEYDDNLLINDIKYNINAGADVLINKWEAGLSQYGYLPTVGNMDPNILENWYFALWGYNSYVERNNPNALSQYGEKYTYQDLIYYVAENEYGQTINPIDPSYLPESGTPSKNLNVPTPEDCHTADILLCTEGDKVSVSSGGKLNLRREPNGKIKGELTDDEIYTVIGEAVLEDGYYWYNLVDAEGEELGWAARNWLIYVEDSQVGDSTDSDNNVESTTGGAIDIDGDDIENGNNPEPVKELKEVLFKDIDSYWGRDYIVELYQDDIIKGMTKEEFAPEDTVTREQFAALLCRAFDFDTEGHYEIGDKAEIGGWAYDNVATVVYLGIMETEDGDFSPKRPLSRIEAVRSLAAIGDKPEITKNFEFEDVVDLSNEDVEKLGKVFSLEIMNGKSATTFAPLDFITRGEIAKILCITRSLCP
jgi:hypothetical protein